MTERPLGVVIAGTGFGCFTHVPALRAAGFEVRALVGRDPQKTVERAAAVGIANGMTSFTDALALDGVDCVTIATPPHTHAALALEAIAAGKHVICEKPLARDTEEARGVLAHAEAAGVVHMLGTEFRFDAGQALLARAIADGAIGEPRLATVILHVGVLADAAAEVPGWWAREGEGGGWLNAHGSQVIDQIRATLGEFEGVCAALPHVADRTMSAEDAFTVQFRLRSGVVGVMQSTSGDWGPPMLVTRVTGSRGTVWIEGLGDEVRVADRGGTRRLDVPDELRTDRPSTPPRPELRSEYEHMIAHGLDIGPYTRLAEHFRNRILGQAVPPGPDAATFSDGVAAVAVLDAIRASAKTGEWVTVTPDP